MEPRVAGRVCAPAATACPSSVEGPAAAGRWARPAARAAAAATTEREDAADVDHLTREDEETWFEGAEDATPPVWE